MSEATVPRRRVLIVVSSYAPAMIADMHRARQLAWELPKFGWKPEVLTPDISYQQASSVDVDSGAFFPPTGDIRFVPPYIARLFQWLGMRSIGWRALVPMLLAGNRILPEGFDIVYISTTQFCLFLLGPLWLRRFHIPYVLDFHDPCVKEENKQPIWATRWRLRHSVSRWLVKYIERVTTRRASALVSVSPKYLHMLSHRYGASQPKWMKSGMAAVIPFGVLDSDLGETASRNTIHVSSHGAPARIIYVGAGGPIMQRSFGLFCASLSALRLKQPSLVNAVRIELYGTHLGWRKGDPYFLADIAEKNDVGDLISESPSRVSYRRSLELLLDSAGALILGVDDAGYMPSKLFPYAYSGKPLLAILRRDGPAFAAFQDMPVLGHATWFDEEADMPLVDAIAMLRPFLEEAVARRTFDRRAVVQPFTASAMAERHADLFERVLLSRAAQTSTSVSYVALPEQ